MASRLLEHFQGPAGTRDSRASDRTHKRTLRDLTGTTADGAQVVAALAPGAGVAFATALRGSTYRDVGWCGLLADLVRSDREECVGGTLRARPAVARR